MSQSKRTLIEVKVPASTANIGPGFDTLGMALGLYLRISAELPVAKSEWEGIKIVGENLVLKAAMNTVQKYKKKLPEMKIKMQSDIPMGSGLGSSGAAVVAGVILANCACELSLSKEEIMSVCLELENHPDNISASLYGGLTLSMVLSPNEADSRQMSSRTIKLNLPEHLKVITATPNLHLATSKAREVLPHTYTRDDAIFNLQRAAMLTHALTSHSLEPELVYEAMKDKMHQDQRASLIPGLKPMLEQLSPRTTPGLLGVCLSGAGPTILALATENECLILEKMKQIVSSCVESNDAIVRVLEVDHSGATWAVNYAE